MKLHRSIKKRLRKWRSPSPSPLVFQHKYEGGYEDYLRAQIAKAKNDTGDVWADEKTLDIVAAHAEARLSDPKFGLCHGSKSGWEARHLADALDCKILGTDLHPPAYATDVMKWDFHDRNPEWIGKADIIYTNSFDHAFEPQKVMDAWIEQLSPGGLIYIEYSMLCAPAAVAESDPFGAHPMVFPYLLLEWGKGRFGAVDLITPEHKKPYWKPTTEGVRPDTDLDIWVFVISRF